MTASNYRVRRATLDDIDQLTAIWKAMSFPGEDLAKRIGPEVGMLCAEVGGALQGGRGKLAQRVGGEPGVDRVASHAWQPIPRPGRRAGHGPPG